MRRGDQARSLLTGAAAGICATAAMSAVLVVAGRLDLLPEQPPRAIVRTALPGLGEEAVGVGAVLAHVGYGTTGGIVHRTLLGDPGPFGSLLYALGIYAGSYQGWVPLLGALPPAIRDDRRRQAAMIVAHVVYGSVLGVLSRLGRRPSAAAALSAAAVESNE